MRWIRKRLDGLEPLFTKGGPLQRFHALFEALDTFLYSPADTARTAPHVRDAIDLKRVMIYVWVAALPAILFGLWNTGYQANTAMASMGIDTVAGWRGILLGLIGAGADPQSIWDCFWHGAAWFVPIFAVTFAVGIFWEILFAAIRNHEVNEGFFVTSLLYALILPASTPLWQVALGITFGVVIAKEVFGGTGKNFVNPALAGRAFLFFAYPANLSGDSVWTPVDGFSGATPLAQGASGGIEAITNAGISWMDTFLGLCQGAIGSTSAAACLLGGAFLIYTGVASYRIILGVFAGMLITTLLFNALGGSANPMNAMPWYWHLALGGFAFGMVFMATDPVTACSTDAGRWIFGALVGALTVVIRVANPAYPEGIMLAILFANLTAPVIDWGVVRMNVRRRRRRLGGDLP